MSTTEIFAQRGSINNIPTIQSDYSVSIVPGAAFRDNTYITILQKLQSQLASP